MNFDDHEIWGAPVRASESTPEAASTEVPAAPAAAGRLYRSAGSDPHPDAILALPARRHTTVQPVEAHQWATPPAAEAAPSIVTINSRIPKPGAIDDPALAEIIATPEAATEASPLAGFTSWFKSSNPMAAIAAIRNTNSGVATPPAEARAGRMPNLGSIAEFGRSTFSAAAFAGLLLVVTAGAGIVNAAIAGSLGIPTGIALLAASIFGAWNIAADARWSAWVMPSYALIGAVLIAGQFTDSAPGAKPLGQIMLIVTGLITLAPWLALSTVAGVALPAIHGRTK